MATILIVDDYREYLTIDPERLFDSHGRGIMLADSALDLEYLDPGNQILVFIPFADAETPG